MVCLVFGGIAVTSTTVGLYWDISWHTSIGRDTFWTPAHLCIHFGAILAGLSSTYLILTTTFGKNHVAAGIRSKDLGILRALRNLRLALGRAYDAHLRSVR